MMRRTHKKSRRGCLECKRRHVKCDEARPRCRLCVVCEKECSFTTQAPTQNKLTPIAISQSFHGGRAIQSTNDSAACVTPPCSAPNTSHNSPQPHNDHDYTTDTVNFGHMELLAHYQLHPEMFNLGVDIKHSALSRLSILLESVLAAPYLMYELLACSARHLAHMRPERSTSYLDQAVAFRTRAISLFTAEPIDVDETNCVPVLLFSSALGYHLLADALSYREPGGLDAFISHYVQFVTTHRGVYNIAISQWPLLMQSKLGPILKSSASFTSLTPTGKDCQRVLEMVDRTRDLSAEEKEACKEAIQYLQVGLDAGSPDRDFEPANPHQMILEWTMLISPTFTSLLAAKRPVSLVILAHYAIMLHRGKGLWQVGDAGAYVLRIIKEYLGLRYEYWLELPWKVIAVDPD